MLRKISKLTCASAALLFCTSVPVFAAGLNMSGSKYRNCITQVDIDARAAFNHANRWFEEGGGQAARHCQALALSALGQYDSAARLFDTLGEREDTGDAVLRAEILAQAGHAWMLQRRYESAIASFSSGIALAENRPGLQSRLLLDRGLAYYESHKFDTAINDVNTILSVLPEYADAFVLRAKCQQKKQAYRQAYQDLELALTIDDGHIEALMERGYMHREILDFVRARADWEKIVRLAPETSSAAIARSELSKLSIRDQKD